MNGDLNDFSKIGIKGFLDERQQRLDERFAALDKLLDERFDALDKALVLQAEEYKRRLHDLNGEYQRDRARQTNYVSAEKFEDNLKAEKTAREAALLRVDEKFDDYIKRYEVRQREVDLLLAAQAGAADEAKRAVEEQGRKQAIAASEQARKQNRNLGLASLGLGILVFGANFLPTIVK